MEIKVKGKFVTSSKVKNFQNPSCHILEKVNKNNIKRHFLTIYHDALYTVMTSYPPSEGVSEIPCGSICSRSL
jgi:hypothetical protein